MKPWRFFVLLIAATVISPIATLWLTWHLAVALGCSITVSWYGEATQTDSIIITPTTPQNDRPKDVPPPFGPRPNRIDL
jgi:hypothetical protein